MPKIDTKAIEFAYKELGVEAVMLKQVNLELALSAFQAKAKTWELSKEKLKKEGLVDKVQEAAKQLQELRNKGDFKAFSALPRGVILKDEARRQGR